MGVDIRALYAWYSPDVGTYGASTAATPDGAGMLELDHAPGSGIAVDVVIGAPAVAKVIKGAFCKDFSQTVKTDEVQGTTRRVYRNLVQVLVPFVFPRIYLQLHTVVDTVNSTFKFRLNDDDTNAANDSASSFSYGHGNQYDWLIVTDNNDWVLYVNGVEEIRFANTLRMGVTGGTALVSLQAQGSDDSGNSETRFGPYGYVEFDGASDLPDVASTVFAEGTLNGESATWQDYVEGNNIAVGSSNAGTDKVLTVGAHHFTTGNTVTITGHSGSTPDINGSHTITVTSTTEFTLDGVDITTGGTGGLVGSHPNHGNVDDWEFGPADNITTRDRMVAAVGVTKLQAYTTPTYTVINDHVSVVIQAREKAQTGSKFGSSSLFIYDGSNITHAGNLIPVASWGSYRKMFPFAPGGFVSGIGIAFVDGGGGSDSITDGSFGLGVFSVGDVITVSGTASNDGDYTVLTVSAGTITVATGSLTTEGAGSLVTLSLDWVLFSKWPDLELGHRTITDPDEGVEAVELTAIQGEILDLATVAVLTNPGDPQNFRRQVIL